MRLKLSERYLHFVVNLSLRARFLIVLTVNCMVCLALVGSVSYYDLRLLYQNTRQNTIQSSLDGVRNDLKSAYQELDRISKQFAYSDFLTQSVKESKLDEYMDYVCDKKVLTDQEIFAYLRYVGDLRANINYITAINPLISYTAFYSVSNQNKVLFANYSYVPTIEEEVGLPRLYENDQVSFNAIHRSVGRNRNVISIKRKVERPEKKNVFDRKDIYVYTEIDSMWLSRLFQKKSIGIDNDYVMLGADGSVLYSTDPQAFEVGTNLNLTKESKTGEGYHCYGDYYLFSSSGGVLWTLVSAVKQRDYNAEMIQWMNQFLVVVIIALTITSLMSLLIWKSIYKPIIVLKKEIQGMPIHLHETYIHKTKVKDFDDLLIEFQKSKQSIVRLMKEVETRERRQKELEVEKLLIQINPHFMHNTLNSIQWMARLNKQTEIEKMTSLFIKVLNYNLGKQNTIVTLEEELAAVRCYIELQEIRYHSLLGIQIKMDDSLLHMRIPRFILQPLIENAILYGKSQEGASQVQIKIFCIDENFAGITVQDNGEGMTQESLQKMFSGRKKGDAVGMGIGLQYVIKILQFYYGNQVVFKIESNQGEGTKIQLKLPLRIEGDRDDKSIDCR